MDASSSCWNPIRRRIPWTLIRVAVLLFADEYRGRLFELLYRNRRRIPWTLIRVAGLLFADAYRRRLFKLLNSYSQTNATDDSSCCIVIADEYRWTLIRVAELLFADEYRGRLFELLDSI